MVGVGWKEVGTQEWQRTRIGLPIPTMNRTKVSPILSVMSSRVMISLQSNDS